MVIDGWRLDVPMEINDDAFWPSFQICGQRLLILMRTFVEKFGIMHSGGYREISFDAVMNYIFSWSTMSFAGGAYIDATDYHRDHLSFQE